TCPSTTRSSRMSRGPVCIAGLPRRLGRHERRAQCPCHRRRSCVGSRRRRRRRMRKLLTSPWTLLAGIALLRLPGFAFGVLNIDESDYLVYGAGILKGLLPYRDLVEIKPPLGYLTYALAGGLSIWPIRILGFLWGFCTRLLLRSVARRWMRRD